MIAALGSRIARVFERTAPDPLTLAVVLTIIAAILSVTLGDFATDGPGPLLATIDAWRSDDGLWGLLGFAMQMCLILVTGHAVASSAAASHAIKKLAALPRTGGQGALVVGLIASALALLNWGLCLIGGALLAREVGRGLTARGVRHHYPLLAAAGYAGMAIWHGGLSGSAPLTVSSADNMARVLPEDLIETIGPIDLEATVFSPLNLFVTGGLVVLLPLTLWALAPGPAQEARSMSESAADSSTDPLPSDQRPAPARPATAPEWMARTPPLAWLLAAAALLATARFLFQGGPAALPSNLARTGLNEIILAVFGLGLLAHGSLHAYGRAVENGARACAGIILQFPLYAGIAAMLGAAGLTAEAADRLRGVGPGGLEVLTFGAAAVVNFFVPSGGGQFGVQGELVLRAGLAAGVEPGRMIMAFAYGDQLTNMLQPFWALPLLAITGCKAREIVGYTAVVMVVAAAWSVLGLLVF